MRSHLVVVLVLAAACSSRDGVRAPTASGAPPRLVTGYGTGMLRFEKNLGQFAPELRYAVRSGSVAAAFTDRGARMLVGRDKARKLSLSLSLVGGRARTPQPDGPLATKTHYLLGAQAGWHTDVPSFARLRYGAVKPGVDVLFHGSDGRLEYDFELEPGVRPESLVVAFGGAERLSLDVRGGLRIHTPDGGVLEQPVPVAFDEDRGGVRRPVAVAYRLIGRDRVGFRVTGHDPTRRLVIDPVIVYASFLGGDGDERVNRIFADGNGALFLVGFTASTNFPHPGALDASLGDTNGDAFVAKVSPTGSGLEWATYLGGARYDEAFGLWIDGGNKVWVTGGTQSGDFPMQSPYQTTPPSLQAEYNVTAGFVARLSANGATLEYGTYFGNPAGCCNFNAVVVRDIFVTSASYFS